MIQYDVPFDLGVDKPTKEFPCPVVKKEGKGGEKIGDVLRAATCWSQGFNAAGVTSDIMAFAGTVKWRKGSSIVIVIIIIIIIIIMNNKCHHHRHEQ